MSTKCSLAHGDKFHLYAECLDDKNVYLELLHTYFEASHQGAGPGGQVVVAIPLEVWEVIRQYTNIDLSLADKSDGDLMEEVEKFVKERTERVEALKALGKEPGIAALLGCMVYGSAEDPVADQIKRGMDYSLLRRKEQQEIRDKIQMIKGKQRG